MQLYGGSPTVVLRLAFIVWSAAVLAAIAAAPLAASAARPEAWFLYHAFDLFCHQQPQRSWHLEGYPLAVCVRCFGVYAGLLVAALAGLRLPLKAFGAAFALGAVTWAAEFMGLVAVSTEIRFLTGLAFGGSLGAVAMVWLPR